MSLIPLRQILQGSANPPITVSANSVYVPPGYRTSQSAFTIGTVKSAQTYVPSTSSQVISQGHYLTGNQVIEGDANLVGQNIVSGISIFGVSGTAEGGIPSNYVKLGYVTVDGQFQPVSYAQGSFVDYGSSYEASYYTISVNSGGQESDSAISDSSSGQSPLESGAIKITGPNSFVSYTNYLSGYVVSSSYRVSLFSGGSADNISMQGGAVQVEGGTIKGIQGTAAGLSVWQGFVTDMNIGPSCEFFPVLQSGVTVSGVYTQGQPPRSQVVNIVNGSTSSLYFASHNINVMYGGIGTAISAPALDAYAGGTLVSCTVSSGDYMGVHAADTDSQQNGSALYTTVSSGGFLAVKGGTIFYTTIKQGGIAYAVSGATCTGMSISKGGLFASPVSSTYPQSGGTSQLLILQSGETKRISSGNVRFVMIYSGGYLAVVSSAPVSVDSVVCLSGGSIYAGEDTKLIHVTSMSGAIITGNGSISYV